MNSKVIVIGAGGHGRVVADIVRAAGDAFLGFLDDDPDKLCLGPVADCELYRDTAAFVLAIGDPDIRERLSRIGLPWHTAVHPTAVISPEAEIGAGTVVMANAVVNNGARLGKHCIVNTGAVVEHDCVLGDFVHISPHATLCGTVSVGEKSHIGAGAVVKNNLSICEHAIVGCGAAVVRDISEPGSYAGVPAKRL